MIKLPKKLIIGLGSGRCGTGSLAILLNMQPTACVTHEGFVPLPWIKSFTHFKFNFEFIINTYPGNFVGDVAFYHLPYVEWYMSYNPETKFVCLKRDKQDTLKSFIRLSDKFNNNHFTDRTSKYWNDNWVLDDDDSAKFRNCFPKFDANRNEAVSNFYDLYYLNAERFQLEYPDNFKIFDTYKLLNGQDEQEILFDFLNIVPGFVMPGIKFTKGEEVTDKWRKSM